MIYLGINVLHGIRYQIIFSWSEGDYLDSVLRQLGILSEEWVIKSFGVLHEECEEIIGGTDIPNVDYDIFRYLQFGMVN